mgnify:CR=1 FL=1
MKKLNKDDVLVFLNKKFQKHLFSRLLDIYTITNLSRLLDKHHSLLYHYKNCRVNAIPYKLLVKATRLANIPENKMKSNIVSKLTRRELYTNCLDFGRNYRRKQLSGFRKSLPSLDSIFVGNYLEIEKWFFPYKKLIDFGSRDFKSIKIKDNKIILSYTCFSNGNKKLFVNYLPRKIRVDDDFLYFFGLWCGDRLGKGRFGVANKDKAINMYTKNYLKKLYQKSEFTLIYNRRAKKPLLSYPIDKVIFNKKANFRGYCVHVGIKNGILFRFFDYLYKNLDNFLEAISHRHLFFAGLFDAEGNVFLEDNCYRWSCLNKDVRNIYIKYLKNDGVFHRFDGGNLVSYNLPYFREKIYPYLKHTSKLNKANMLIHRKGNIEKRFLNILKFINIHPGSPFKDIAKSLKRVKMYSQIRFLERMNYITKEGYPMKIYITKLGLGQLQRGQGS